MDRQPSSLTEKLIHRNDPTGGLIGFAARYFVASSSRGNRSPLMPGAGSPGRYRGATCSSQARSYKPPTVPTASFFRSIASLLLRAPLLAAVPRGGTCCFGGGGKGFAHRLRSDLPAGQRSDRCAMEHRSSSIRPFNGRTQQRNSATLRSYGEIVSRDRYRLGPHPQNR